MKNINKNLIKNYTLGLGIALTILAILAIGSMLMPTQAHADTYSSSVRWCSNCQIIPEKDYSTPIYRTVYQPIYETQPVVYKTQPVVYQNTNYSNPPQATTSTTSVSNSDTSYKTSSTGITSADYSNLTANSLFGRFSFMPSGLMQWILLGIFILVIVILIRKVTGKDTAYYSTPLKHA